MYDKYSIRWGYRPILDAATPEAERPTLDQWIREHEGDPMYMFGDPSGVDHDPADRGTSATTR